MERGGFRATRRNSRRFADVVGEEEEEEEHGDEDDGEEERSDGIRRGKAPLTFRLGLRYAAHLAPSVIACQSFVTATIPARSIRPGISNPASLASAAPAYAPRGPMRRSPGSTTDVPGASGL